MGQSSCNLLCAASEGHNEKRMEDRLNDIRMKPQATKPATVQPTPNHEASQVTSHCLLEGKYSKKTVVSKTKLPPAPNAEVAMKNPSDSQFGDAPATIVKIAHIKSDTLKEVLRPMISALKPQNSAPTNIPTYTAIVKPLT